MEMNCLLLVCGPHAQLDPLSFSCCFQGLSSHISICHKFLLDFAKSDPAQEFSEPNSELFKGLIQACKKQAPKSDIVAGSTVDRAVNATFAALVYLSSDLFGKLQRYGNSCISEYLFVTKATALVDTIQLSKPSLHVPSK